ncbi:MAG TPA: hypothetical protein VMU06_18340 [Stellaceae bacterium]|nr:hypothetical protein [Stellaceae bacterium]
MRAYYLDTSLRNDVGHHGNFCRRIVGAFRARGIETLAFGHREVEEALRSELGVAPHFRVTAYNRFDPDPIAGWLNDFLRVARWTREDLNRLPPPRRSDIVLATSIRPAQLLALVEWQQDLAPDSRPAVVAESTGTGLAVTVTADGMSAKAPNPHTDPRATLYRFIGRKLPREAEGRFHFATFGRIPSELFHAILQFPVRTLPLPFSSDKPPRARAGARSPLVAVLGHQRAAKGYDLLPEIVEELLRLSRDFRLLLQVVAPVGLPEVRPRLAEIARRSGRVILEEEPAGRERWPQLMEMTDLALCPYRSDAYQVGISAVAAEAIPQGIPLVVPAATTIETLVRESGAGAAVFDRFEPAAIAAATSEALDRFDELARLSYAAALRWPETQGPARLVEELLALCEAGAA